MEKAFYRTWSLRNPSAQEPLTVRVWGNYMVLTPFKPQAGFEPPAPQTAIAQVVTRDVWASQLWVLSPELVNCQSLLTHTLHSTASAVCPDFSTLCSGYLFSEFLNLIKSCRTLLGKNMRPTKGLQSLKMSCLPWMVTPITTDTKNNCKFSMSPDMV